MIILILTQLIISDLSTKLSRVCNIEDKTTGSFFINEAFTFESIDLNDLKSSHIELDIINSANKIILGKVKNYFLLI